MGRFIVIEGLDGSGKTTQSAMLAEHLRKLGMKVRELSFPCYGEKSCALVEMYLAGELSRDPDDINGYASSVFFAADRYISYITDWKRDHENEDTVIVATRYTTSNAVHQLSKIEDERCWRSFLDWLYDTEFSKLGLPEPDDVVLLSADPSVTSGNVDCRCRETGQKKDIHELDADYLFRCNKAAKFAAEYGGWKTVECAPDGHMLPKEEIFGQILNVLNL